MAAMYRITPDTVIAASQGTSPVFTFGGPDPRSGQPRASYETPTGGFGAPAGGRVVMEAPGWGGFGVAERRDPARLRDVLADGYVSSEAARREYGDKP